MSSNNTNINLTNDNLENQFDSDNSESSTTSNTSNSIQSNNELSNNSDIEFNKHDDEDDTDSDQELDEDLSEFVTNKKENNFLSKYMDFLSSGMQNEDMISNILKTLNPMLTDEELKKGIEEIKSMNLEPIDTNSFKQD